ncbi:GPALPP motifs-containing protein 1 [Ochlerotatus camptorhynchus]|uniref:GPALPP motifs-containing protein 1 n=1 Tax=Ochlerotatus camptorhynchus TaxID=644619 RepID=UPI0031D44B14
MSDSDTSDSDSGIRFKTTSTRYKPERIEKHSSSSKSSRSTSSTNRRSRDRDRDRGRDKRRSSVDRKYSHRSRSRSRSRSRDRRKRRERDRRRHRSRSRSRSRSKQSPRGKQEREKSSVENRNNSRESSKPYSKPCSSSGVEPSKIESGKILDISVSSLSSQEEAVEKDEAPVNYFGPVPPPVLHQQAKDDTNLATEEMTDTIGPALPPHLIMSNQEEDNNARVIGPTLPANLKLTTKVNESSESELSPFSEEEPSGAEEDDDFIGPMPGASSSRSQLELEQRALELKLRQFDADRYDSKAAGVKSREDWMIELPDIRKVSDMGLGARQFRTREKQEIGDRSVWTDTPSDRERKKTTGHSSKDMTRDRELEEERRTAAERDKQQEEMIKRHKKKHKRDKSLLELHQKKEKEKAESDEPTRRPFDRNVDLQANRFDEAQKKAIVKKAQLLDTRFSSGASKYL